MGVGESEMTKYAFADAAHSVIKNTETGATFEWPRHVHISNVQGHAAEQFRADGCPWPAPFVAPAVFVRMVDAKTIRLERENGTTRVCPHRGDFALV